MKTPAPLTETDLSIAHGIATHHSITRACEAHGKPPEYGYALMVRQDFCAVVQEARAVILHDVADTLTARLQANVDELHAIANDKKTPTADRIAAYRALADLTLSVRSEAFLTHRLAVLEASLAMGVTPPPPPATKATLRIHWEGE